MKVTVKNEFPVQTCKTCKSLIKVSYKDLKYEDDLKHRKNRWKCPLCKENQNFLVPEQIDIKHIQSLIDKIDKRRK